MKAEDFKGRNMWAVKIGARAYLVGLDRICPHSEEDIKKDWEFGYDLGKRLKDEKRDQRGRVCSLHAICDDAVGASPDSQDDA